MNLLQEYDNDLSSTHEEIRLHIERFKKSKEEEKQRLSQSIENNLNFAKISLDSFRIECREAAAPIAYKNLHVDTYNQLKTDWNYLKPATKREEVDLDSMTTKEILARAKKVQDESLRSLDHSIERIEKMKEMQTKTANKLSGGPPKNALKNVNAVKANLKSSDL